MRRTYRMMSWDYTQNKGTAIDVNEALSCEAEPPTFMVVGHYPEVFRNEHFTPYGLFTAEEAPGRTLYDIMLIRDVDDQDQPTTDRAPGPPAPFDPTISDLQNRILKLERAVSLLASRVNAPIHGKLSGYTNYTNYTNTSSVGFAESCAPAPAFERKHPEFRHYGDDGFENANPADSFSPYVIDPNWSL